MDTVFFYSNSYLIYVYLTTGGCLCCICLLSDPDMIADNAVLIPATDGRQNLRSIFLIKDDIEMHPCF